MSYKILLINGKKAFAQSQGRYNDTLHTTALFFLAGQNHQVKTTFIDDGYDIEEEVEKWVWADTVIYQMPGWWMGPPWTVKHYMDEVFTAGHGRLYANDGRSSKAPEQHYGSGGLLHGKHYMISVTWNAPEIAFTDPAGFFEGKGVDAVYFPFHKAHEFLGMSALPSFICCDVMKAPNPERDTERYTEHLKSVFMPSSN